MRKLDIAIKPLTWTVAVVAGICFAVLILSGADISGNGENPGSTEGGAENSVVITIATQMVESGAIPIAVRTKSQFTITLPSNPTTGYKWRLANRLDAGILKCLGSKYNAPTGNLVGQGGTETWNFQAVGKGKATITLEYARPWEKDVKPAKTQKFAVVIK